MFLLDEEQPMESQNFSYYYEINLSDVHIGTCILETLDIRYQYDVNNGSYNRVHQMRWTPGENTESDCLGDDLLVHLIVRNKDGATRYLPFYSEIPSGDGNYNEVNRRPISDWDRSVKLQPHPDDHEPSPWLYGPNAQNMFVDGFTIIGLHLQIVE